MKLLTTGNPKTQKSVEFGYLTGILHLAPYDSSGYQVCSHSTESCRTLCLYHQGRGRMTKVQEARLRKTKQFFKERSVFMEQLEKDITSIERKAVKNGLLPAIRLNGTSDIPWEGIKPSVFDAFPDVQFYDYTKIPGRKKVHDIENYHITFSGDGENVISCEYMLRNNFNVAIVWPLGKDEPKPTEWRGYPVVDGDVHDLRFLDPDEGGHIIGLRLKGANAQTLADYRWNKIQSSLVMPLT